MLIYSLPLYEAISMAVVPLLRHRLDENFSRNAENQAMLVKTDKTI